LSAPALKAGLPGATLIWVALGWIGYAVLPWYGLDGASFTPLTGAAASGLTAGLSGAWWLLPVAVPLLAAAFAALPRRAGGDAGRWLVAAGLAGLALVVVQGAAIGLRGWNLDVLPPLLGSPGPSQRGMGFGAALTSAAFLLILCHGLAARGWCRGDAFGFRPSGSSWRSSRCSCSSP
jgi:iron(III) transport system permease protein